MTTINHVIKDHIVYLRYYMDYIDMFYMFNPGELNCKRFISVAELSASRLVIG